MFITQEIPIIQNKLVYFVGSSDLGIDNQLEITDLILTLKGFLYSLENQEKTISELTISDLEILYNKVYQAIQDFSKIQKRTQYYQYFGNKSINIYFENIINELKILRKKLLKIIEGELLQIIT